MNRSVIVLIAIQFFKKAFNNKGLLLLWGFFIIILGYTIHTNWKAFEKQHRQIELHQEKNRSSWEDNPDKHPHRMAHFGTFVFRQQHPLRIFDSGIESYIGNSIFLEAHKQHTANFSEASLSTGLARFGDLNLAILLQLIIPLIIFFIGYGSVSTEKENGTLKMIYIQGTKMKELLLGKSMGLLWVASLFFLPVFFTLWAIIFMKDDSINSAIVLRVLIITIWYLLFFMILSGVTVIISAKSSNTNRSLLSLLGIWLSFFIIIPKMSQTVGNAIFPNLSQIEFKTAIEKEVAKQGDSHDPNDPYFNHIRDSVLQANKVKDVKDLPFNYGGFIMGKGEKQTAMLFNRFSKELIQSYKYQNSITDKLQWVNPYLAMKKISMSFSGTDFDTYVNFLDQTERYRYKQSQYMNSLQMKHISNKAKSSEGKTHVVGREHWSSFPDFVYEYVSVRETFSNNIVTLLVLCFWILLVVFIMIRFSNQFKII